ncbi:tetraspanin-15 [Entelurus aequoreus]|uniref:tetraspanin-15 n=1 Tax=Entelurus aequoreus TaxID=161455 RepID=UPI002B1E8D68|nr:tetraspanin-15 [Entelurus aequoreus]XP_061907507.1 tetraspanin-15 [Entelurus aequoreus]
MPPYSELKRSNHFYYFIKFTLNVYSMLFSLMGLCVLCVGVYAEVERQKNRTLEGLFLAPAVVLILLGLVMFTVSLVGMVGSLRDNKTLLHMFLCVLCVLLLLQAIALIIALLFEKKTSALFQSSIREGIKHYYDDLDFKNILDYVQEKFSCCGGDEYKDWAVNQYHFCNGTGPLACGVPYTCCIPGKVGEVINTLCGSKAMALDKQRETLQEVIHVRGCIHAVNLWMTDNIGITIALCCAIGLPQLLGIVLTCLFWNLLVEMSQSVDMVDFKLKKLEFKYSELDLAGAGCCMCLPRDGGYLPIPVAEPDLDPIDVHLQKLKKQPPRTHSQLLHLQQSRSTTGLDEVDIGRKLKREH